MKRVAIIGGGSVAASFLHHLIQALERRGAGTERQIQIQIFEPRERIGPGLPYDEDLGSNLLNLTAGTMSVAGDDRGHFLRWLAAQGQPAEAGDFLPRPLFGRYLHAAWQDTQTRAQALGIRIEHLRETVIDLVRPAHGALRLHTASSTEYEADHTVLALGNLPSTAFTELRGHAAYFDSPYPARALTQLIPRQASVCIIGTSLSAIDAVVALAAKGHEGAISCVSRNGRLPAVRGLHNPKITLRPELRKHIIDLLTKGASLSLHALMTLLERELMLLGVRSADIAALAQPPRDAHAYLDAEIAIAGSTPRPWQSFGNALNEIVDALWHLLPEADKAHFDAEIKPIWMSRRVSFPMQNALTLQTLMHCGQLQVRGGYQGHRFDASTGHYCLNMKDQPQIKAEFLVNATSFSCNAATTTDSPLLQKLLQRGDALADRFGGLALDFATGQLQSPDGTSEPRISVLGSMAVGTYFWTNSMDVNARLAMGQAERLAHCLSL